MGPVREVLLTSRSRFHDLLVPAAVQLATRAVAEDDFQQARITKYTQHFAAASCYAFGYKTGCGCIARNAYTAAPMLQSNSNAFVWHNMYSVCKR